MTVTVEVKADLGHVVALLDAAGARAPVAIARALNRAGQPSKNAHLRQMRQVLGLKPWRHDAKGSAGLNDYIRRRTSTRRATPANLEYSVVGFGEGLNLKYYQPRETPQGATVMWLGARRLVPRSFYLSGFFPRRRKVSILTRKAVFRRQGAGKWNFAPERGPGLPEAMAKPSSGAFWLAQGTPRLNREIAHQLAALLSGAASSTFGATV
jgi:hypothetical protein